MISQSTFLKPRLLKLAKTETNINAINVNPIKAIVSVSACMLTVALMGCQSKPYSNNTTSTLTPIISPSSTAYTDNLTFSTTTNPEEVSESTVLFLPNRLTSFNIEGKLGAVIPASDTQSQSSGSAFYAWAQEDNRFSINLTGALGIGRTDISYDGQTATLNSERTGIVTASSPDALLTQATGWQAPISQLPYWISGSPAPSDNQGVVDNYRRLIEAQNGDWAATFRYANNKSANLPDKINILRGDGHKLVMTIQHTSQPTLTQDNLPQNQLSEYDAAAIAMADTIDMDSQPKANENAGVDTVDTTIIDTTIIDTTIADTTIYDVEPINLSNHTDNTMPDTTTTFPNSGNDEVDEVNHEHQRGSDNGYDSEE